MATKTVLIDDLDGGSAESTVTFALDGKSYSLDLSKKNAGQLRKALEPYVSAAKSLTTSRSSAVRSIQNDIELRSRIREWGRENGYEIADRGRIPAEIQEAFDSAHG